MYRNQYDTDVTTFSPAGRLHQVEYAAEAVKQGSAAVGLRGGDVVVIASLKRSTSELASFQKKVFKIDDHLGITVAGLISDGRVLTKYMISECLNHKYVYGTPLQLSRLVTDLSDKSQKFTHNGDKRPYGVGLLVAGHDETGPHLFQTDPSGNFFEYWAQSIGARSQSAKTYLEKHYETFNGLPLDDLIMHALEALKTTLQGGKITSRNVSVGYVSKNQSFTILEDDAIKPFVDRLRNNDGEEKTQHSAYKDDDEDNGDDGPSGGDQSGATPGPSGASGAANRPAAMEDDS